MQKDQPRGQQGLRLSIFGPEGNFKLWPVQYNPVSEEPLANTVYVGYRDDFRVPGSKPSKSVTSVIATKPALVFDCRSPVITHGMVGPHVPQTAYRDLDMTDFRTITDYFISIAPSKTASRDPDMLDFRSIVDCFPPTDPQQTTGETVLGVRINCVGDHEMLKKRKFEPVQVSFTDAIFSEHHTSSIADRIGLPLFTRRLSPDPGWASTKRYNRFDNVDATFLHVCCDPKSKDPLGWGWAPAEWQSRVGSTIVVRQDKKPLSPLHVEALCHYCQFELQPLFGDSIGENYPKPPMSQDAVLTHITRAAFTQFWYRWLSEWGRRRDEVPFPYDV